MTDVGTFDQTLRAILGFVLLALLVIPATAQAFAGLSTWIWALSATGAIVLLTAIFHFCPAYTVLGICTCAIK